MTIKTDRTTLMRCILISLILFMAAHAFCIFNLSLRGESVMLNAEKMNNSFLSAGQFLRPLYLRLRGGIASPLTIGLISFCSLTAACILLFYLCGMDNLLFYTLLSGLLLFNPAVLEQFAGSLLTADMVFLSFFLLVAGPALLFIRPGFFPLSALLLFLGLGLSPQLAVTGLCVPLLFWAAHPEQGPGNNRKPYLLTAAAIAAGAILFAGGVTFFSRRNGIAPEFLFAFKGQSLKEILMAPFTAMFTPATIYPHFFRIFRSLVPMLAIVLLIKRRNAIIPLALLCVLLMLPSPGVTGQFSLPVFFLDAMLLLILYQAIRSLSEKKKIVSALAAGLYGFFFLGELLFANQAYLKINLDLDTSLSVMTQVIHRLENREDFIPGQTQTAFIGSLSRSPLVHEREGFEHLAVMDVLEGETSLQSQSLTTWFFWQTLGYPMNCLSDFEQEQLADSPEVAAMPVFPHPDSIRRIEDTLVVHLSR